MRKADSSVFRTPDEYEDVKYMTRREKRTGNGNLYKESDFFLFVSPWIIGFFVFTLVPMAYSLYTSFTSWNGLTSPVWIGWANYVKAFTQDSMFIRSIWITLRYALYSVPLNMVIALFLAVMLNQKLPGTNVYRSVFYLPSVIGGVAMYIAWQFIFDRSSIMNYTLTVLFGGAPGWITDPEWAMPSLVLINVFNSGSIMLILLAALQDVSPTYYEAAQLDGAGRLLQFFNITVPMITPTLFYILIMQLISALQIFTQPYVLTKGGPLNAIYTYGLHLYNQAFRYKYFGYASCLAWILFVLIMAITIVLFKTSKLWVFYREEVD